MKNRCVAPGTSRKLFTSVLRLRVMSESCAAVSRPNARLPGLAMSLSSEMT